MRKVTITDFNRMFPDEGACLDFLRDTLYPYGVTCRKCERITKHHRLAKRRAYSCQECGTHVYPLAGTIFAKSRTPLKLWFYGMFLMASTRCGISAKQLERELGVSYPTALRMFRQIRSLLGQDDELLSGTVEMDESYFGGKDKWKHEVKKPHSGRGAVTKTPVFGIAQRGSDGAHGKVSVRVADGTKATDLLPYASKKVLPASTVYTDDFKSYNALEGMGYEHSRVNHSQSVYVSGNVHTNTIEGFWATVKRGIG